MTRAAIKQTPTPQAGDELARENVEYGIAWLRGNLGSAEPEKLLAAADAIERLTASGNDVLREACLIIGGFLDLGQQDALVRRARVWLNENPELERAAILKEAASITPNPEPNHE